MQCVTRALGPLAFIFQGLFTVCEFVCGEDSAIRLNPDIVLLQKVRDYRMCLALGHFFGRATQKSEVIFAIVPVMGNRHYEQALQEMN
jgi:hypothetical protein